MTSRFLIFFASALLLAFVPSAHATGLKGRYFMVVWGFQEVLNLPADAQTFASFYRGDDLARGAVEPVAISWLPATGVVREFGEERGKNFSLAETLRIARRRGALVEAYGPYEITPALYERALARIRLLKSGKIAYTMITFSSSALNCISALSGIGGPLDTGLNWGHAASLAVAAHLSPRIVAYPTVNREAAVIIKVHTLAPQLGRKLFGKLRRARTH